MTSAPISPLDGSALAVDPMRSQADRVTFYAEAIRHELKTRTLPPDPITGLGGVGLTEFDIAKVTMAVADKEHAPLVARIEAAEAERDRLREDLRIEIGLHEEMTARWRVAEANAPGVGVDIWSEVRAERARAHAKHGDKSMESASWFAERRLRILLEEIGEVARELNDAEVDSRAVDALALRKELIQVAAMAGAWADAVPVPTQAPEPPRAEYPDPWNGGPHSRACGIRNHEHGSECHSNCPTCGGKPQCRCGCGGALTIVGHVDRLTGRPATIFTPPEDLVAEQQAEGGAS